MDCRFFFVCCCCCFILTYLKVDIFLLLFSMPAVGAASAAVLYHPFGTKRAIKFDRIGLFLSRPAHRYLRQLQIFRVGDPLVGGPAQR